MPHCGPWTDTYLNVHVCCVSCPTLFCQHHMNLLLICYKRKNGLKISACFILFYLCNYKRAYLCLFLKVFCLFKVGCFLQNIRLITLSTIHQSIVNLGENDDGNFKTIYCSMGASNMFLFIIYVGTVCNKQSTFLLSLYHIFFSE